MNCEYCGQIIPNAKSKKKICLLCNPYNDASLKSQQHVKRAMAKYPEKVKIIYECRCKNKKKRRHHFDYSNMFDVLLLCCQCHMAEHNRILPGYNAPATASDREVLLLGPWRNPQRKEELKMELTKECPKCNETISVLKYLSEEQVRFILDSKNDALTRCDNCNKEIIFYRNRYSG